MTASESDPSIPNPHPKPASYASRLMSPLGLTSCATVDEFVMTDEDVQIRGGTLGPNVCFSQRVKDKLELEWRCAVIVKLIGKPNSTNAWKFMVDSLKRKWKLQGPWQLIDLPNDYFIVKFHLPEDMNIALCGRPWIIAGQTLVVQQWRLDFNPHNDQINRMAVWIRILGLPVAYSKEFTLNNIGNVLGTVVKIDQLTLAQSRGKFSRLCVEIDLHKPLLLNIEVEGVAYSVVYEGISMICFNCGCYGHVKANCTSAAANNSDNVGPMNMEQPADSNNDDSPIETDPPKDKNDTNEATPSSGGPGPWMLMLYKNKKTSPNKMPHNAAPSKSGSRFALLQTFTEDGDNAMNEQPPTPIEELTKSTSPSEPKIVTMWKRVQEKLPTDGSKSNYSGSSPPKILEI